MIYVLLGISPPLVSCASTVLLLGPNGYLVSSISKARHKHVSVHWDRLSGYCLISFMASRV